MTEPSASASTSPPVTASAAAALATGEPANADALLPAAEKGGGPAAKCLGLFVILAIVYFWNLYCLTTVVPKVKSLLDAQEIALNDHQQTFAEMSNSLAARPSLGAVPIGVIAVLGCVALVTRYWSFFGGVFFSLIVALFLFFLYGWLIFAVPLIQIREDSSGAGAAVSPDGWRNSPAGAGSGS